MADYTKFLTTLPSRFSAPFMQIYDDVVNNSANIKGVDPDQHLYDILTLQDYLTRSQGAAKARGFRPSVPDTPPAPYDYTPTDAPVPDYRERFAGGGSVMPGIGAIKKWLTAAAEPMGIVKNNNGQWLGGNVQRFLEPLMKTTTGGLNPAEAHQQLLAKMADPGFSGMAPELQGKFTDAATQMSQMAAHNDWMNKVLGKTIQNSVAAPSDPFRALADQGITHFPTTNSLIKAGQATDPYLVAANRSALRDAGQLSQLGETDAGRAWERAADELISIHKPSWFSDPVVVRNPWMNTVDPNTSISHFDLFAQPTQLGLQHLSDAVTRHIENKGTAQNLSVEKAIRSAHDWHQEQLAKMAKDNELAQSNILEHNAKLGGTPHPNGITQYDYNKTTNPDDVRYGLSIDSATAQHCVGQGERDNDVIIPMVNLGTKQQKYPDNQYVTDVLAGRTNITSFRNPEGKTLATIQHDPADHYDSMPPEAQAWIDKQARALPHDRFGNDMEARRAAAMKDMETDPATIATPNIGQISGPGNGHVPMEARDAVQAFLNSREWGDVQGLGNVGLVRTEKGFASRETPTPVGPGEDIPFAAGGQVRKAA